MEDRSEGLNETNNGPDRPSKKADASKGKSISFGELFSASFMKEHTRFSDIDELFSEGGFEFNAEGLKSVDEKELDKHISAATDFDSWDDMMGTAFAEFFSK
jgi:hypothetical protein